MAGSLFSSIAARSRSVIERVHGEAAMILPMDQPRGPNGARAASHAREPWPVTACFWREPEIADRDMRQALRSNAAVTINRAGRWMASVRGLSGPEGQKAKTGDILVRAGGQTRFEIGSIDPDDLGNFNLTLAEVRGAV